MFFWDIYLDSVFPADDNICAQTWHSMSGFEHKHSLELASPVRHYR